jgi:hypothetical protein
MRKTCARSSPTYLTCRRWTVDEAKDALAAQERSGLSLRAFATREGLDVQRLERWRRRLAEVAVPGFEEVIPPVAAAAPHDDVDHGDTVQRERFEIVLREGRVLRVPVSFDASSLRRLLEVLAWERTC